MTEPTLSRLPDWPARLHDFIDTVKRNPFDWASHNCVQLAAGAVVALTGEDLAASDRTDYKTHSTAAVAMKRRGFTNLADAVAGVLPEIHISQAQLGDIAAIPKDDAFGFTLGIVNGEMILVLGEDGMGTVPLLSAARAFSV